MIDLLLFFTSPLTPVLSTFAMIVSPSDFKKQSKMSKMPNPFGA